MTFTFAEVVGAILSIGALVGVEYGALFQGSSDARTSLVGLLGVAAGYWLRAKLQPSTPDPGPQPPVVPHG